MNYFLDTVRTIEKGLGFKLFDLTHIGWLVLGAVCIAVGMLHYRGLGEHSRARWRKTAALFLVGNELFKQVCLFAGGNFTINYLPLHLCNINIFLIAYHAWRPNQTLGNFLYTICVPATVAALLFPSWEKLPVLNFMHLHSFTLHIGLALYPLVLTAAGDIRPDARQIPKCLAMLVTMACVICCINLILDTNYFYLMNAPKGNPLYIFQQLWGDHRLGFPVIIGAVLAVMYLPVTTWSHLKGRIFRRALAH